MLNPQQFRDRLAVLASRMSHVPGRSWRPLQDTADEAPVLYRAPVAWRNWRRGADFYDEGFLLWLDADTTIREASGGARSLDDFARAFFGVDDAHLAPLSYTFEDVVAALNQVQKYDWHAFLSKRLQSTEAAPPLNGLTRGGWKLVYTEEASGYSKALEKALKTIDLTSSLGLVIADVANTGQVNAVADVVWGSPAFEAGVAPGMKLIAVDAYQFSSDLLKEAIKSAKAETRPIELLVESSGTFVTLNVDYHGGLNYPHLERIGGAEDRLSAIGHPKEVR
jgi:predicted metalloprotease with PDZ domain